ncbi:efflux RND transporter periplasmic adaptor subunit [Hoeflea sp. AS16]|uniref:efflux RND transporter periplasmic adaptor subunit n=1 Tax=Hoeflea sp. AS16 TaxID=3135779 RepID=UPI00316F9691
MTINIQKVSQMRRLVTLVVSAAIVAGAYFIAFGVPASLGVSSDIQTEGGQREGRAAKGPSPAGRAGGPRGARATTVVLTPLQMQPYEDILRAIGSADAVRSASVISNVSGDVIETNLSANKEVSAGDVLVQLDARTEMYNLEIAQAELEQARDKVLRYERLLASGNSSITDVALAEARVAQRLAEAKVGLARVALDDRTIKAPISGKLGLSDVEIGDTLSAGSAIVTIDDAEALLVVFELPERSVGLLEKGQTVLTSTPTYTGQVFEGEIVSFDSRIDSVTRSVTVHALIDNSDGRLWPGMSFAVRIVHESDPLAVLPSTAITWSRSGSSVWIDNNGVAEQVSAAILYRRDDQVWIEADIAPGAMVVSEGAQKLRAGSPIVAANAAEGDPVVGGQDAVPARAELKLGQAEPQQSISTEKPI